MPAVVSLTLMASGAFSVSGFVIQICLPKRKARGGVMNLVTPSGHYGRAGGGAASVAPSNGRTRLELAVLLIVCVGEAI